MSEPTDVPSKVGFVAVVGRPNVGKSTLVNRLVGQRVAIVSDKPQTTRNRILAVANRPAGQIVLFDTPGIHKPAHAMNRRMVDLAVRSLSQVDVALWVVDVTARYGPGERYVKGVLAKARTRVVVCLNKIDLIPKLKILPIIETYRSMVEGADIVPVSALDGQNVDRLEGVIFSHLPEGDPQYPADYLTDQPERLVVAELVREKLLKRTQQELPYSLGVLVESWKEEEGLVRIHCSIFVEREGQKGIVIGRGGLMLKAVGTEARKEIEALLGARVHIELFVKVRPHWREDKGILESMGLTQSGRG